MSSTQSFSFTVTYGTATGNFVIENESMKLDYSYSNYQYSVANPLWGSSGDNDVHYGTSPMNTLYPNATCHPIKANLYFQADVAKNCTAQIQFSGTTVATINGVSGGATQTYSGDVTNSVVTNSNRSTIIRLRIYKNSVLGAVGFKQVTITTYFTRYDFTATAGSNVTAASVSSSTGYDGDTIQYRCTLASGAEWQGWYRNGSLYSSTKDLNVTVSGTDLALEARATMSTETKTLSATYNNAQISGFPKSVQSAVGLTYGGASAGSIPISGGTKTFTCGGKLTASAIGIGGTTLNNSGKMMATDVVVTVS